jgi:hypothetical protein
MGSPYCKKSKTLSGLQQKKWRAWIFLLNTVESS